MDFYSDYHQVQYSIPVCTTTYEENIPNSIQISTKIYYFRTIDDLLSNVRADSAPSGVNSIVATYSKTVNINIYLHSEAPHEGIASRRHY